MNRYRTFPPEWRLTIALFDEIADGGWFSPGAPFASVAIARAFKNEELTAAQRTFVVETLHYMLAHYRRLDFALQEQRSTEAMLLASLLERGALAPEDAVAMRPKYDWTLIGTASERTAAIADSVERFAIEHSFPDFLARRLLAEHGVDSAALARALNERPPTSLRANTLRCTPEELRTRLNTEGVNAELKGTCLAVDHPDGLFKTGAFRDGLFEVQDQGSQWIADLVSPPPHGKVLDACAGSGGKTLALSALMRAKGTLLATDSAPWKLEELRRRARRANAFNVQAVDSTSTVWAKEIEALRGRFDRVLIDAPCSGVGSLRRNPELRWRIRDDDIASFAERQFNLAKRGLELLAENGRLIYATCSLLREENEGVVARLCAEAPLEILPVRLILGAELGTKIATEDGKFLKLLPHRHGTDGFFAAVLRRTAGVPPARIKN